MPKKVPRARRELLGGVIRKGKKSFGEKEREREPEERREKGRARKEAAKQPAERGAHERTHVDDKRIARKKERSSSNTVVLRLRLASDGG